MNPLAKGGWQVAYGLYERFAHMVDTEELRFIAPNECITRDDAELAAGKPPKAVVLDANKTGLTLRDEEALTQIALTQRHRICPCLRWAAQTHNTQPANNGLYASSAHVGSRALLIGRAPSATFQESTPGLVTRCVILAS